MKTILVFSVCFIASLSQAQTAIIAHKSHSGKAVDFFTDPSTNFGIPSRELVQVVYLNDSTTLNVYTRFGNDFEYDTIHAAISYALDIDSIKKKVPYLREVEYINFKDSPKDLKPKTPGYRIQETENKEIIENETPTNEPTPKKKKKSYLLFLFGITGGGMLLMRLFSKSKHINSSIA